MKKKRMKALAVFLALTIGVGTVDMSAYASESSVSEQLQQQVTVNESAVSSGDITGDECVQGIWDGTTTQSVYETDRCRVIFSLASHWKGGYNANIKIENISDRVIENWYISYDFDNIISNIWNAEIHSHENGSYIIKNAGWNQDIAVGGSVEFGFSSNEDFMGFPTEYELLGESTEAKEENYTVEYRLDSDWGSGFTGTILITNNTDTVIEDWILEFDFEREITSIWNGVIESYEESHYTIRNAGYNSNIGAGQTIMFGFTGQGGNASKEPYEYQLYSYQTLSREIKFTADKDADGAPDYVEEYFRTDITKDDTDGDGISDYLELYSLVLDPLSMDTDQDGVSDADEDIDSDGLSNITEIEIGSNIVDTDPDKDELTDYEEVVIYGTSPANADTDGDGVSDSKELSLGTNPLTYEETFDVVMTAKDTDTVKVSVEMEISGEQAESLKVERYENELLFPETMPGYIGGAYDFKVDGTFETATIEFKFDELLLENPDFDPVIYYFNEETQLLEEFETTVVGNVASAEVLHFSKYILLNRKVFQDAFAWQDVWDATGYTGVEVVLVIDDSGSMTSNDGRNQRLAVAQNLIDKLPDNNKIGIVKFENTTSVLTPLLTNDKEEAKSFLTTNYFKSYGSTYMYRALNSAFSLFESTDNTVLKMMVVLSDGNSSDKGLHSSVITTANNKNIKIYTVGLGSSSSYFSNYLKPLAENTAGAFYLASDASQLETIFKDINKKIDIETDSDADGIPDYYEENMVLFNGVTIKLDKNNPDSDGDGLYDGEEVVELNYRYNADKTQVIVTGKLLSNPLETDTDGDGLTDEEEIYYYGTDPMAADTDGDGLPDNIEIENWFDPIEADADGDGRLDLQEYLEGTSPFKYDKEWYDYVWDFICGFIAGDFIYDVDSVATLLGQITSSCIPLIDIRDIAGNLVHGDYLFAGLSGIGLIPVAGDATKTASKVGKFILKNIDDIAKVADLLEFLNKNFPDIVEALDKSDEFVEAAQQLVKANKTKLTKKEAEAIDEALKKAGLQDIIKGGTYTNLDDGLNFSNKALEHMGEAGRQVPVQTLQDAIRYGEAMPDPRGSSATMYYTTMYKNGKMYNLEVLYDEVTNTVYHFEYARKAMGNLPAISK